MTNTYVHSRILYSQKQRECPRSTQHSLSKGYIPADKMGGSWCEQGVVRWDILTAEQAGRVKLTKECQLLFFLICDFGEDGEQVLWIQSGHQFAAIKSCNSLSIMNPNSPTVDFFSDELQNSGITYNHKDQGGITSAPSPSFLPHKPLSWLSLILLAYRAWHLFLFITSTTATALPSRWYFGTLIALMKLLVNPFYFSIKPSKHLPQNLLKYTSLKLCLSCICFFLVLSNQQSISRMNFANIVMLSPNVFEQDWFLRIWCPFLVLHQISIYLAYLF